MEKQDFAQWVKCAGGCAASVATFLWGKPDLWFYGLIALTALDYVTGIAAALIKKELSSRTGLSGIIKKLLIFAIVAVAQIVDMTVHANGVVRNLAIGFLLGNEGLSILENCGRCGVPIPKKLMDALEQLKE